MPLPRWLFRIFPRLAPRGEWGDAEVVADPNAIARLAGIYAETVEWCRAKGFPILAPACEVTFRVWPDHLRVPDGFKAGQVLAPNVINGDAHGSMVVRRQFLAAEWLIKHESWHAITGDPTHPKTAFNPDGSLKGFPNG